MAGDLFEKMDAFIKAVRYFALGIALAIVSVFVLYFVCMTVYRLWGLCARLLFSAPWGI
jgi:hypothetical protein